MNLTFAQSFELSEEQSKAVTLDYLKKLMNREIHKQVMTLKDYDNDGDCWLKYTEHGYEIWHDSYHPHGGNYAARYGMDAPQHIVDLKNIVDRLIEE